MKKYNPKIHHRRSIRLKGYDYSQVGAYFVTIVTQNRRCLFGDVFHGEMRLSPIGEIAQRCWLEIPKHFTNVELDEYVIMPNHVHGIIMIHDDGDDIDRGLINQTPSWILMKNPKQTLGKIIRHYKARTTKIIRTTNNSHFHWQRNYYDHIIRSQNSLNRIREYIVNNPLQWSFDSENPDCIKQTEKP